MVDRRHGRTEGDPFGAHGQTGQQGEGVAGGDVRAVDRVVAERLGQFGMADRGGERLPGRDGAAQGAAFRHPATRRLRSSPTFSTVLTSVVPAGRKRGGPRGIPPPGGGPVKIRSPGSNGPTAEGRGTRSGPGEALGKHGGGGRPAAAGLGRWPGWLGRMPRPGGGRNSGAPRSPGVWGTTSPPP